MNFFQVISRLIIPSGLVLLLSIGLWNWTPRPELLATFLPVWPYIVLLAALLLGCRYQRSRLLLIVLVLTITSPQLLGFLPPSLADFTLSAVNVLLPLNLLWIACASERHLVSFATLLRVLAVVAQGGIIWLVYHFYAVQSTALLRFNPFQSSLLETIAQRIYVPLLPLSCALFALTFICFGMALLWRPTIERGAWVVMLASVFLAQRTTADEALFYTATALLVLIVALLETSHSMAFRDELTGLGSRRALNDYLHRLAGHYTLAMVDIDHFKSVNDTYGHDIGDQVLKMVAGYLAKVAVGGKAFRYGGEEFTLVFATKQRDQVLPHLEALRLAIAHAEFALRSKTRPKKKPKNNARKPKKGQVLNVTVSMGVAEHSERKQTADQVIKIADNALYRAKHSGRNRIC